MPEFGVVAVLVTVVFLRSLGGARRENLTRHAEFILNAATRRKGTTELTSLLLCVEAGFPAGIRPSVFITGMLEEIVGLDKSAYRQQSDQINTTAFMGTKLGEYAASRLIEVGTTI
jgi:hypothetical protein